MLCAKILRLNLSEMYQYLDAKLILNAMVGKRLIQSQKEGEVEGYSSQYAQNIIAGIALFEMYSPSTNVLDLCHILRARDSPEQKRLAALLRSGICCIYVNCVYH